MKADRASYFKPLFESSKSSGHDLSEVLMADQHLRS